MTDYALQGLGAIPCDVSLLPKENKTRTAKLLGHRNAQAHGGHLKFSRCQSEKALSPKSRRRGVPKSIVFKCFLCIYMFRLSGGSKPLQGKEKCAKPKALPEALSGDVGGSTGAGGGRMRAWAVRGVWCVCGGVCGCLGGCVIGTHWVGGGVIGTGSALGGV